MQGNVRIAFRHTRPLKELVDVIEREADKLQENHHCITSWKAVIDCPHRRHRNGNRLRLKVFVSVPGMQLISSKETGIGQRYMDSRSIASDTFNAMEHAVSAYLHHRNKTRSAPHNNDYSNRGDILWVGYETQTQTEL